jgi:arylsulfatase A-like enzyme
MIPIGGAEVAHRTMPTSDDYGPVFVTALPGYWEQFPEMPDTDWCESIRNINDGRLTEEEKFIACKTRPRTPPKHVDLDLLDMAKEQIASHDYEKGPLLQIHATAMMHLPLAYPKEYDDDPDLPEHFRDGEAKPQPSNDDLRHATNMGVRFLDDLFGATMQAIKDAGQWDNTIVFFTTDNGGAIYNGSANNNYPLRSAKFSPLEGTLHTFSDDSDAVLQPWSLISSFCTLLLSRRRSRSTIPFRWLG